jgi:hypothetical protein
VGTASWSRDVLELKGPAGCPLNWIVGRGSGLTHFRIGPEAFKRAGGSFGLGDRETSVDRGDVGEHAGRQAQRGQRDEFAVGVRAGEAGSGGEKRPASGFSLCARKPGDNDDEGQGPPFSPSPSVNELFEVTVAPLQEVKGR